MNKLLLGLIVCVGVSCANSLWSDSSHSPYVKKTAYKVGDTITIVIDESLNAAQSGTTKADKNSGLGMSTSDKIDNSYSSSGGGAAAKNAADSRLNLDFAGRSTFAGTGKTTRQTAIRTNITATVIDVQPNGSLFVLGQRQIKVNDEAEQLEVSGVVSIDKISDANTVYSTQLANAKIAIKGAGTVSNQQQPGVMSKLFDWMF